MTVPPVTREKRVSQQLTESVAAAIDDEALQTLYAKTTYRLRESRKALLQQYAVESESILLEKITSCALDAHPAYEHYLSALIIEQMRMQLRAEMAAQLGGICDAVPVLSVHLLLKQGLETHYGHQLSEPVQLTQDALLLSFNNGLMIEVHYFSSSEYAINWSWGDALLRIDTAPVHTDCPTFPHHLHDHLDKVLADPVTQPGADCWSNFSRLLDALLENPLLEAAETVPD
jgi:hypothetical protein